MSSPIRILIIDDHTLFRESLVRLLEAEQDIHVVSHIASIAEAVLLLKAAAIDVILLDYDLGEGFGTELLRDLHAYKSSAKVLMVTAGMRDTVMLDSLKAGVSGIFFKHNGPRQLLEAIHKVARGEIWLDTGAMRSLIAGSGEKPETTTSVRSLTERQHQVLRNILDGLTNKEIAAKLQASETSVKAVIQELFTKAGVRTRSQLVRIAIEKYAAEWLRDEF